MSMPTLTCSACGETLPTKNKLFQHLQQAHAFERDSQYVKPPKISVLIGFLSDESEEENSWVEGGFLRRGYEDAIENSLWKAVDTVENISDGFGEYPKGFSRGNASAQRSSHLLQAEANCDAVADLFCFSLKKLSPPVDINWMNRLNAVLPAHIRALEVFNMPSKFSEFHAEQNCSQRVYEYIIPLSALYDTTLDDTIEVDVPPPSPELLKKRAWNRADGQVKIPRYTARGLKRIEVFRSLKKILKQYSGYNKRRSYHNFVTGGACPEDAVVNRRVDRVYHKDIIVPTADDDIVRSYKKSNMQWEDVLENEADNKEEWAVFSISADSLLRGQARKMLGLAIAICKGLLPPNFIDVAFDTSVILDLPSLPSTGFYSSETKFDKWETKFGFELDPRRSKEADVSRVEAWLKIVRANAIRQTKEKYGSAGNSWLSVFEAECSSCLQKWESEKTLRARTPELLHSDLHEMLENEDKRFASLPPAHKIAYKKVLRLLQKAESSGLWPSSSLARQKVVTESTLKENGGSGGTFTIGVLPGSKQPKNNDIFPELLLACFELEQVIAPHRPPSSTIAVNKHAQFRPHRDTGVGNGQSKSLIVALGDFSGGELMAECKPNDIRYAPLEFDGWNERHWTLPFEGHRYSLVWFTPCGVRVPEDLFWIDKDSGAISNSYK